jgi:hypothetical protein
MPCWWCACRFYQLLKIDTYIRKLESVMTLVVDILRLTQHVTQLVDRVAQANRANSVTDWIGEFSAYNVFRDLNAISEYMTFFEELPKIQKELARIQDIPEAIQGVYSEFYAMAITDPQDVLDAYAYVQSQAPGTDAAALARELVEKVTLPLSSYLGGKMDIQASTVVENAQGLVAILRLIKEGFPPKSLSGLKLKPHLEFKPFLWTWNTWFYFALEYPEFGLSRCYKFAGKKCFTKIPTMKMSTKQLRVPMPNEHRPGFAFMLSVLEV